MKKPFMIGLGVGFILGNYVLKKCPSLQTAVNNAENSVKTKVEECKSKMQADDGQI